MRRALWLSLAVLALATGYALIGLAQGPSEMDVFRGSVLSRPPMLLDGDTMLLIGDQKPGLLSQEGSITGFAFGPGRNEVAFCTQTPKGRSGLYVVTTIFPEPPPPVPVHVEGGGGRGGGGAGGGRGTDRASEMAGRMGRMGPGGMKEAMPLEFRRMYRVPESGPRLVWTAPEGVTLRGPVWWSPNGEQIALREVTAAHADLISVSYASGKAVPVTQQATVTDAAWAPDSTRIAYVAGAKDASAVFLQTLPPAQPRRLGEGGLDLRWSVDGQELRWIVPGRDTWTQWAWDGERAQVTAQLPPRAEGAMWSPDGRLCAVLEGEPKHLTLYPTTSTVGETVELSGVQPQRLLGWSPDSRVVLVLAQGHRPVAVSVRKVTEVRDDIIHFLASNKLEYKYLRASAAGPPLDPEAGLPSWSSRGDWLVYVWASEKPFGLTAWKLAGTHGAADAATEDEWTREGLLPKTNRALLALPVQRQFVSPREVQQEEQQRVTPLQMQLLSNVKNIAMALQMYLTDFDAFPNARNAGEARAALDDYLKNDDVWLMPRSKEVVVRYLAPPGLRVSEIEDPAALPVVVVDILPDWDLVGYADGHAKRMPKGMWKPQ